MNTTPRHIVAIVVYTLAILSMTYVGTLAWCVIAGLPVQETLGNFCHVGDTVIGAFTGMLINTRSGPAEPVQTATVTQTTETTNPPPNPP